MEGTQLRLTADADEQRALGDIGDLYTALSGRLEKIVRAVVRAPDVVVEDACQFAWSRLLYHRERVRRDTALGWLAKTAVREASRATRRRARELPLDADVPTVRARVPGPAELVEQTQTLKAIGSLPRRQQRVLWLTGLGLSYREMARHETCTPRTVERQLTRARQNLRELVAE
jgi:RNA polymerase sigma factor (sigma-70 family)